MSTADGPFDLAPAARRRTRARVAEPAVTPAAPSASVPVAELLERFAAVESVVHAIDVRMEAIERLTRSGLVLERLLDLERLVTTETERQASTLGEIAARVEALAARVEAREPLVEETDRRVADAAVALAKVQASVDALDPSDMRAELRLVADRLGTLLGGPTLTELMDRIDELQQPQIDEPKRRRRG